MKKQFIIITYVIIFLFLLVGGIFYLIYKNQYLDNTGNNLINSGNFSGAISYYEKKLKENNTYENKVFLINSYLEYGNSFYKEAEYSKKALAILDTMEEKYDVLYSKGYANEIIKNYTGALSYYNKGLQLKDLDNKKKSILLNQIGHLYDLKGDIETAYKNYKEAYAIYNKNFLASVNIGRYFARKGNFSESKKFFEYGLGTESKPVKSEIYYSLSTIELELNGLKPDINKSIEYSKKSIEEYPNYAMGYVALARGYYMFNDKKYYKEIKDNLVKSMVLNNKGFEAYSYSGLLEFDKGNYDVTVMLMKYSIYMIKNDIILMDNERITTSIDEESKIAVLGLVNTLKKEGKINDKNLFEKFEKLPFGKNFIKFQLKRTNHGIFSNFKGIEEYVKSYK